jgi:outer membrane protein assembly factor BamB
MNGLSHDSDQGVNDGLNAGNASKLSLLWSFATGGPIISEPIVSGNVVYFGSWDGHEYAVSAEQGDYRWSTYLGQSQCTDRGSPIGVSSTSAYSNGTIYVGGGGEYWDALSASNGSVEWSLFTGNNSTRSGGHYNWASPNLFGGFAYVGIASHCDIPLVQGRLLKVDLASRSVFQTFNTTSTSDLGASIWASPAINPVTDTVFAATGNLEQGNNSTLDDSILAFNMTTLQLEDRFQIPYAERHPDADFGASPTLYVADNGVPMVADTNKNGYLYGLDQENLSAGPVWSLRVANGDTFSSAAYSRGTLFVGSSSTTLPNGHHASGALWAVNATTGSVEWTLALPGTVFGPVAASADFVVAAGGRQLIVANQLTGQVKFRFIADKPFYGGASIADGRILCGDNDGTLYAFGIPLRAGLNVTQISSAHPLRYSFSGSATGGAHGYSFEWNLGDGTDATRATITHVYSHPGNYTVTLSVTDQAGASLFLSANVVVTEPRAPFSTTGSRVSVTRRT